MKSENSVPVLSAQVAATPECPPLAPLDHLEQPLFLTDFFDYVLKEDGVTMEAAIFAISSKPDQTAWEWKGEDGKSRVNIYPSPIHGRATQFDKDLLIFATSLAVKGINVVMSDSCGTVVRFRLSDYLVSTNRPLNADAEQETECALGRLRGTFIETNIRTGGRRIKGGFGIISSWEMTKEANAAGRVIHIKIALSKWISNALRAHEVVSIHPDYFQLKTALERRFYELARKYCAHQTTFSIGLAKLKDQAGSTDDLSDFRRQVQAIVELPGHTVTIDDDKVTFRASDTFPILA